MTCNITRINFLLFFYLFSLVVWSFTSKRHATNTMVEVLVEPCGQEAIVSDKSCKINDSPMERLTESDRCDLILEKSSLSPIQNFYNGQSIFVTGGTGFMGKILIEKLLRECPGISFIYMLVRPKKGKDMHQRIEELFDDPVKISIIFFFLFLFSFFIFLHFISSIIFMFSHFYIVCLNSFIFLLNFSTKYFSKHCFSFRHYRSWYSLFLDARSIMISSFFSSLIYQLYIYPIIFLISLLTLQFFS